MTRPYSIRLPQDLAERLDAVARETDRSRSYIMQKALEAYLDDAADLQIALDRLRDGSDRLVSPEEIRKDLEK